MATKRKAKAKKRRAKKSTTVSAFSPEQMRQLNQLLGQALKDKAGKGDVK